jgi:hypothetical protein
MSSDREKSGKRNERENGDPRGAIGHPNLSRAIKASGMKNKEFAERVGKTPQTVSGWISGKAYWRNADIVESSAILGCSILYLLGLTDDPSGGNRGDVNRCVNDSVVSRVALFIAKDYVTLDKEAWEEPSYGMAQWVTNYGITKQFRDFLRVHYISTNYTGDMMLEHFVRESGRWEEYEGEMQRLGKYIYSSFFLENFSMAVFWGEPTVNKWMQLEDDRKGYPNQTYKLRFPDFPLQDYYQEKNMDPDLKEEIATESPRSKDFFKRMSSIIPEDYFDIHNDFSFAFCLCHAVRSGADYRNIFGLFKSASSILANKSLNLSDLSAATDIINRVDSGLAAMNGKRRKRRSS